MSEVTIAQELRQAAKAAREETGWPGEAFSLALAEWLEAEAHMVVHRGNSPEGHTFHALKVAHEILGITEEVPGGRAAD